MRPEGPAPISPCPLRTLVFFFGGNKSRNQAQYIKLFLLLCNELGCASERWRAILGNSHRLQWVHGRRSSTLGQHDRLRSPAFGMKRVESITPGSPEFGASPEPKWASPDSAGVYRAGFQRKPKAMIMGQVGQPLVDKSGRGLFRGRS